MQPKLDVGSVLSKIFATYQQYLATLLTLAIGVAVIQGVFRISDSWVLLLVGFFVSLIVQALFTASVVELVNDTRDGELDQSLGGLIGKVTPVLGTLILASILVFLACIVGLIGCFVGAIAVYILLSLVPPLVVVERLGAVDSLKRSWKLVWPHFWQVLLVLLVCWLITIVIGGIASSIFGYGVVGAIVVAVVYLFLAPIQALASSILYFELVALESGTAPSYAPPSAPTYPPPAAL